MGSALSFAMAVNRREHEQFSPVPNLVAKHVQALPRCARATHSAARCPASSMTGPLMTSARRVAVAANKVARARSQPRSRAAEMRARRCRRTVSAMRTRAPSTVLSRHGRHGACAARVATMAGRSARRRARAKSNPLRHMVGKVVPVGQSRVHATRMRARRATAPTTKTARCQAGVHLACAHTCAAVAPEPDFGP